MPVTRVSRVMSARIPAGGAAGRVTLHRRGLRHRRADGARQPMQRESCRLSRIQSDALTTEAIPQRSRDSRDQRGHDRMRKVVQGMHNKPGVEPRPPF